MLSKQGGKEFLGAKRYPNIGVAKKQSEFEFDRKLMKFYEKKVSENHFLSLDTLQAAITEVWEREISPDYCCKLIDTMPSCMQEVIKNKGCPTKNTNRKICVNSVRVFTLLITLSN